MAGCSDCPALHSAEEEELIASYFDDGYTYAEICTFLNLRHGIVLTVDQLRYRLKKMGLGRRQPELQTPLEEVEAAISVSYCMLVCRMATQAIHYYTTRLERTSRVR